jgi:hypothetical protein
LRSTRSEATDGRGDAAVGADALVQSRNHNAAYRRELALLEALEARLAASD